MPVQTPLERRGVLQVTSSQFGGVGLHHREGTWYFLQEACLAFPRCGRSQLGVCSS